jgi:putative ABC transport system ATP-binding protein
MELIRQVAVQPGRAVIVVTHDSRVFGFGDRIMQMSDGRVEQIESRTNFRNLKEETSDVPETSEVLR